MMPHPVAFMHDVVLMFVFDSYTEKFRKTYTVSVVFFIM